jgi:hypothetical protein
MYRLVHVIIVLNYSSSISNILKPFFGCKYKVKDLLLQIFPNKNVGVAALRIILHYAESIQNKLHGGHLLWYSSATAVAQFSDCRRTVLPLRWENFATCLALHCYRGGRTLRRQRENCATAVGELCGGSDNAVPQKNGCEPNCQYFKMTKSQVNLLRNNFEGKIIKQGGSAFLIENKDVSD